MATQRNLAVQRVADRERGSERRPRPRGQKNGPSYGRAVAILCTYVVSIGMQVYIDFLLHIPVLISSCAYIRYVALRMPYTYIWRLSGPRAASATLLSRATASLPAPGPGRSRRCACQYGSRCSVPTEAESKAAGFEPSLEKCTEQLHQILDMSAKLDEVKQLGSSLLKICGGEDGNLLLLEQHPDKCERFDLLYRELEAAGW